MNVKLKIGCESLDKDGRTVDLDVAPFLKGSRTFVPIRAIAEAFGLNVAWNEKTQEVTISNEDLPHFDTIEQCAYNWAMTYNNASIGLNREFGSSIYKDDNGYYYTIPNIALDADENLQVVPSTDKTKRMSERIASIHSHAAIIVLESGMCINAGNNFSGGDIDFSKNFKCDNFVATPTGRLLHYNVKTGKITELNANVPYTVKAERQIKKNWNSGVSKTKAIYKEWYNKEYKAKTPLVDFFNFMFYMENDFPDIVAASEWRF